MEMTLVDFQAAAMERKKVPGRGNGDIDKADVAVKDEMRSFRSS